tara:strand:- start:11976 stop:12146 length:171 start_codon:yes stop_codon:yes gene_type:complete
MSCPFLFLASMSMLQLANNVQTNATTTSMPMMVWVIYGLSASFFIWALLRAVRLFQ